MAIPQRLPTVNGDDGAWGDILNQFLAKEHYNTGLDDVANGGHKNVTLQPGTATAGTAPLKFTSGALLGTAEAGALEYLTDTFYIRGTDKLSVANIKPAIDSTTAIGVFKADGSTNVLDVDTTNGYLGIGTTPAQKLDIKNGAFRFTSSTAAPAAPTVALAGIGSGSLANGAYSYKIAYLTALGEILGTTSATVTVTDNTTNGRIALTNIPVSADSLVTSKRVYRTKVNDAGNTRFYVVASITAAATTYTDNISDASLSITALGYDTTVGAIYSGANKPMQITSGGTLLMAQTTAAEGLPTYSFQGDSDTGFYASAANEIGFSVGGVRRMTLNGTGLSFYGTLGFASNAAAYANENWGYNVNGDTTHPVQIKNTALMIGYAPSGATYGTEGKLFVNGNASFGGLGVAVLPTAKIHIAAGTATAGTAPIKLTSGVVLTAAEAGAIEFTTDTLFATITTGAARKGVLLDDGARLTSGKIPIATTNGRLIDGVTPLAGTKVYYVSDTSGGAVTRKLTFTNGILTSET